MFIFIFIFRLFLGELSDYPKLPLSVVRTALGSTSPNPAVSGNILLTQFTYSLFLLDVFLVYGCLLYLDLHMFLFTGAFHILAAL